MLLHSTKEYVISPRSKDKESIVDFFTFLTSKRGFSPDSFVFPFTSSTGGSMSIGVADMFKIGFMKKKKKEEKKRKTEKGPCMSSSVLF